MTATTPDGVSASLDAAPNEPRVGLIRSHDFSRLLATAALFYGVGMVIENLYLMQFGVADFSLLRPRAVVTGLLVALPTLISLGVPTLFERPKPARLSGAWWRRLSRRINYAQDWAGVVILQALPLIYYVAAVVGQPGRAVPDAPTAWLGDVLLPGLFLWFSGLMASMSAVVIWLIATGNDDRVLDQLGQIHRDRKPPTLREGSWLVAGLVVAGVAHLILFVSWVYPSVPRQLDGARPQEVQLAVAAEHVPALSVAGLTWVDQPGTPTAAARLTNKVLLLAEGEDYYLVRISGSVVLQLPETDVVGVRISNP